ncbi:P-loop containing nucleoside triphosphate hydrolase protein [Mucor mucedo]|uniref:P-loop containing nucleoside triphosphate hydrolase protein n=1 Tax=Mucor mucedo TaxID=29922 RepID=UPI00221E5317|nr:P-loop containing nucleoside triphosphate hydrolase protein [Mucor mucedo]KAI7896172.1 P-loop containing nucleoside triphosphate hydrolase protein [Mucor mucedo]
MADALGADVSIRREYILDPVLASKWGHPKNKDYKVAEILVRIRPNDDDTQRFTDLRIVLVGGLGAGKSTLLGHISHGAKDNGRGRARLNLLRHRHELETGRSSSISHEIIGYDSEGKLINYATTNVSTWEQICESSSKIVTFLDTCGYAKYLRTTISGLMGYAPDYACLLIAGNAGGVTDMTKEHLSIAVMLDVPVFVVITKSDLATQDQLRRTLGSLLAMLQSPWMSKVPVVVQCENDLVTCASHFAKRGPELPIFMVSNVTGANMDLLIKFFNYLPKPIRKNYDELLEEPVEFQIEEVFSLSDVGTVVGGVLGQGRVNIRDDYEYHLGPNSKGEFIKVKIVSIHRHRMSVHYVHCGQTATLALDGIDDPNWKIHKGMVLLGTRNPECYIEFEADLMVLYHATGVSKGTCGMVNSGSIRQHARVTSVTCSDKFDELNFNFDNLTMDDQENECGQDNEEATILLSGTRGRCVFKFMYEPCYLRLGAQILFMQGGSKCLGRVTRLIHRE